ncbi:NADPH-dependent FMN reductase [Nocardia sp. CNY236]|uniref:NADPH-dependent FMN reductase n=1 Tax=Nocardia sp. CNY236 TaxID=1169152 RepID=UPI0004177E38|nr:NAD(P)H-dependent oxidoreductase [Nocardia sp. CNY236]
MLNEPIRLAIITGSVRIGRLGPTVAQWFAAEAGHREDLTVDVIDAADVPLSLTGPTRQPAPDMVEVLAEISPRIESADAFVVVTPEYNHSYPAGLKNLIDWHITQWRAKPVGFVSYGGMSGGLRAVEHLRAVFAELHAMTIQSTVCFRDCAEAFDTDGLPKDRAACEAAAKDMLDQLVWWANALKDARAKTPYSV